MFTIDRKVDHCSPFPGFTAEMLPAECLSHYFEPAFATITYLPKDVGTILFILKHTLKRKSLHVSLVGHMVGTYFKNLII